MNVLIACEFSGVVRDAFLAKGHNAVSCDLLPTEAEGPHIIGDVLAPAYSGDFDLMVAHPPCTFLCVSGLHFNKHNPVRQRQTQLALSFVRQLWEAPIERVCIENPVGCINTQLEFMPKPQYVHPYMFGHDVSKKTGLWARGLPALQATNFISPSKTSPEGHPRWGNQTPGGQDRTGSKIKDRWKQRSRTHEGLAQAMADQWG